MRRRHAYDEHTSHARLVTRARVQEEGEYEYASYNSGQNGKEEAHVEEGLLYQPLGEAPGAEGKPGASGLARMCSEQQVDATVPCARYVLSIGEFLGSVQQDAEHVGKWVKRVVHSVIGSVARALGYRNPTGHDAACAAFGVGVNFVLKDSPFVATNAAGVAAALGCAALFN